MVDAREMKKILRNNGYEYQRCKGSHFMYSNGVYTVAVNKDFNDNNQWQFFDNISCNKKSNGLNIEDISILCSLSHSLYNACRDYICSCTRQESFLSNALLLLKWWMGLCVRQILLKKKYFSVTVPVQYMSCWTGLNVFDHVRSYDNPFQQTDNHMELYQKLCARVNSRFAIWGFKKLEFWNSLYDFEIHFTRTRWKLFMY